MKKNEFERAVPLATIPAMEVLLSYQNAEVLGDGALLVQREPNVSFTQHRRPGRRGLEYRPPFDANGLRARFDAAKTPGDVEAFLASCGPFKCPELPQTISFEEFDKWQGYFRLRKLRGNAIMGVYPWDDDDEAKYKNVWAMPNLLVPRGRTELWIACDSAVTVLAALAFTDEWRNAIYKECAYLNCDNIFEITSRHDRTCCTPTHTRMEANRQRAIRERDGKKA